MPKHGGYNDDDENPSLTSKPKRNNTESLIHEKKSILAFQVLRYAGAGKLLLGKLHNLLA